MIPAGFTIFSLHLLDFPRASRPRRGRTRLSGRLSCGAWAWVLIFCPHHHHGSGPGLQDAGKTARPHRHDSRQLGSSFGSHRGRRIITELNIAPIRVACLVFSGSTTPKPLQRIQAFTRTSSNHDFPPNRKTKPAGLLKTGEAKAYSGLRNLRFFHRHSAAHTLIALPARSGTKMD
jgi:hypothetical protein